MSKQQVTGRGPQAGKGNRGRQAAKVSIVQPVARRGGPGQGGPNAGGADENDDRDENSLVRRAKGAASETADTFYQAASEGASGLTRRVGQMLDDQVARGADMIAQVANSGRRAAEDLEDDLPQVGDAMLRMADRIDDYAETIRDQSVEEILQSASTFARRQPMVVFGLAALAGFVVMRAFSAAPTSGGARASRDEA